MSTESKKGYGLTFVLIILGLFALYGGAQWLMVLIPAALLVRYLFSPIPYAKKPKLSANR
jgi:hypothetical protein